MGIEFNDTGLLGFERVINPFIFLIQMWNWWWSDRIIIVLGWFFGLIWDAIIYWIEIPATDKILPLFYFIVFLLFAANGIILLAEFVILLMLLYIANFQGPVTEWFEESWPIWVQWVRDAL